LNVAHRLQRIAEDLGADFFGVANLTPARDEIVAQGGPHLADYPRAVSIGIALLHPIVDQLPQRSEAPAALLYKHHAYDVVNNRLDHIASRAAGVIQYAGYRALPVPASQRVDAGRLCGLISHKLVAHLAGLGWIGKSCMLVTPRAGPRVRWATILTDAPLPAGEPMDPRCGDCRECVDACPVQAFTGRPFIESEPREARFAAHKCRDYFDEMEASQGFSVCGMCLYVCPHGRSSG
jgi:epoxyqueuosine reductase